MKRVLCVSLSLLFCLPAHAGSCFVAKQQVVKQVAKQKVVEVKEVAVAQIVAVPIAFPVYSVGLAPGYEVAPQPQVAPPPQQVMSREPLEDDALDAIRKDIAAIRAELASFRRTDPISTPAGLLQHRCAACHGSEVAQTKGAGFVLLEKDGSLAPLSLQEKRRVVREVVAGRMPKGGTLTEAEKKVLLDSLK